MIRRVVLTVVAAMVAASAALAGEGVPVWVKALADSADPTALPGSAVVIEDASVLQVNRAGTFLSTRRMAVLVRNPDGARHARADVPYVTGESRVLALRGWVVKAGGIPRQLDGKGVLDAAIGENELFSEARARIFDASGAVGAGEIFACEWTVEDEPPFLQVDLPLAGGLPTRRAKVRVELPPGWNLEAHLFGPARPVTTTGDGIWTWTSFDHAGIPLEESGPSPHLSATRVALRVIPEARVRPPDFSTWDEVAAWLRDLSADAGSANGAILENAHAIRRSSNGELDALRAAARAVQQVRYVSIQMGIGRGGGYRPHPAGQVLKSGYGDCKDKANLLVTLVRAMGGRAWLAPTFLGDRDFVHPEWATPQQFNHCIAAIAVSDTLRADAVLHHPVLGALLLVDPTDPDTPLGQLPDVEQGGKALIVADSAGILVELPTAPLDRIGIDCRVEATLGTDGSVRASNVLTLRGTPASQMRALRTRRGAGVIEEALREALKAKAPGVSLSSPHWEEEASGTVRITYETVMTGALQDLGDGAMAWRAVGSPFDPPAALRTAGRLTPVVLQRERCTETISMRLPERWTLDEAPPDQALTGEGVAFSLRTTSEPGRVQVDRSWSTSGVTVPAARYAEVRKVLGAAQAGTRALHVFTRAP